MLTLNMIIPLLDMSSLMSCMCYRAQNCEILTDKTFAMPILIRKPQNSSLDLLVSLVVKVSNVIRAISQTVDLIVTFLYLTEIA